MLGTDCCFRNMRELELHLIRGEGCLCTHSEGERWLPLMDPIGQVNLFVLEPGKYHEFHPLTPMLVISNSILRYGGLPRLSISVTLEACMPAI